MTQLSDVSEPALLQNLYERFCDDQIYSSVGGILVSVNPYKRLPTLYDRRAVNKYRKAARARAARIGSASGSVSLRDSDAAALEAAAAAAAASQEPHIFALVESAYRELVESGTDQALLMAAPS